MKQEEESDSPNETKYLWTFIDTDYVLFYKKWCTYKVTSNCLDIRMVAGKKKLCQNDRRPFLIQNIHINLIKMRPGTLYICKKEGIENSA